MLNAYKTSATASQISILLVVTKIFFQCLLAVALFIHWTESHNSKGDEVNTRPFTHSTEIGLWALLDFFVVGLLSATCGLLTSRVSELTSACVDLLERQVDDSSHKMAKNVIRLCSVQYKEFRACGLFLVDAALPLRLVGLVTTYCIVMLQFAFL